MSQASNHYLSVSVHEGKDTLLVFIRFWKIYYKLIPVNIFESISGERVAELTDLRLPSNINSCIRLQPKGFASDSYFVEDNVIFKDEKGIQQTKTCPVTSFIRWRYAENKDQS